MAVARLPPAYHFCCLPLSTRPCTPTSQSQQLGTGYRSTVSLNVKVLDFVKPGGPKLTVGRTIFEMWMGL